VDTAETPVWSVYLLRCADNSLYTGIATNVDRRIATHRNGRGGAKYLQGRGPFELVFEKTVGDRGLASQVEYRIKQLPKREKERLLQTPRRLHDYIAVMQDRLADAGPGSA
jgi:putative endonuclease